MSFQPLFRRFHETIQLRRFDENAELREKRDRILKRLRDNLSTPFEPFNQGSYAMGTGIKPLDGDYDIDIGIVFNLEHSKYTPVAVKGWVYEAVKDHTKDVRWRRPCITVYYRQANETVYHVDLAILAQGSSGSLRLAIGKQHSAADQQEWQPDDRKGLIQAIENRFSGEDAGQFRRVIRYLKRWKDHHFASEGRAAPTGLSLTVAAHQWFRPAKLSNFSNEYDDLAATRALVSSIRQAFVQTWDPQLGRWIYRISLKFPFLPHDDVFARMTSQQMVELHQRLEKLSEWLDQAMRTGSTEPLRRAFGADFPEK